MNCGDRTCPDCRKKWFGYHYKKLLKIISSWESVHSLTLTVVNIPDNEFGRQSVRKIRSDFERLRDSFPQLAGGFYIVQATNRGKGWHLHLHIIFEGSFIVREAIKAKWQSITGSYIINIKDVRSHEAAIRYLLSDFSGEPRIRPEDHEKYNEVFKRSRLVQGFGKYRKTKIRGPFACPVCGCTQWDILAKILGEPVRFSAAWSYDSS
jgi:hypothetical protein